MAVKLIVLCLPLCVQVGSAWLPRAPGDLCSIGNSCLHLTSLELGLCQAAFALKCGQDIDIYVCVFSYIHLHTNCVHEHTHVYMYPYTLSRAAYILYEVFTQCESSFCFFDGL